MSWVIKNSKALRFLFGAVAVFCFSSTAFAIELGAGETYQQLPGSDSDYEDLIMHPGSEILAREDGLPTSFRDGSFRFNEARVQGDLQVAYGFLDMYQTEVFGNFQAGVYGANIERSTFHNLNVNTYYDEINLNYVAATDAYLGSEDNINIFTGYFSTLIASSWTSINIDTLYANKLELLALDGISLTNADVLGDTVINVDYGPAKISKLNTHSLNLAGSYSKIEIADSTLYTLDGTAQSMELINVSALQLSLEAESLTIAGGSSYGASLVANESVLISDGFKSTDLRVNVYSKSSGLDIYGGDFEKADLDFNTFETNIFGGKFSSLFIDTDFLGTEGTTTLHGDAWNLNGEEVVFIDGIADITGSYGYLTGILSDGSFFEAEIFDEWNVSGGPQLLLVQSVPLPAAFWLFLSSLGFLFSRNQKLAQRK